GLVLDLVHVQDVIAHERGDVHGVTGDLVQAPGRFGGSVAHVDLGEHLLPERDELHPERVRAVGAAAGVADLLQRLEFAEHRRAVQVEIRREGGNGTGPGGEFVDDPRRSADALTHRCPPPLRPSPAPGVRPASSPAPNTATPATNTSSTPPARRSGCSYVARSATSGATTAISAIHPGSSLPRSPRRKRRAGFSLSLRAASGQVQWSLSMTNSLR